MSGTKKILEKFIENNTNSLEKFNIEIPNSDDIESSYEGHNLFVYTVLKQIPRTKTSENAFFEIWCDTAAKDATPRFALSIDFDSCTFPDDVLSATNLFTLSNSDEWDKNWNQKDSSRPSYTIDHHFYKQLILEFGFEHTPKKKWPNNTAFEPNKKIREEIISYSQNKKCATFLTCYFEKDDFEEVLKNFITNVIPSLRPTTPKTTSLQYVQARIGQGKYRNDLFEKWGGCAVTGCQCKDLLVASHILPWSEANDIQKLDPNNGLLLNATLDKLFDRHLMTFNDDGTPLFSKTLSDDDKKVLNLDENTRIQSLEKLKASLEYLKKHQASFKEKETNR